MRRPLIPVAILVVTVMPPLVAACGASSSPSAATTGPSSVAAEVAYAKCMRSHGVSNFPDPSGGRIPKERIPFSNPRFASGAKACARLFPFNPTPPQTTSQPTHTRFAAALAFSRCVREHGFPSFPDPMADGELTGQMVTAAGIDLHQPALLKAGIACISVTHGLITKAAIEHAVNGH